jgi:hypothetical protein
MMVHVTIFSAPNYCDSVNNKGAFIVITPDLECTYHKFTAVPVLFSLIVASSHQGNAIRKSLWNVLIKPIEKESVLTIRTRKVTTGIKAIVFL